MGAKSGNKVARRAILIAGLSAGVASLPLLNVENAPPRMRPRGKVGDIGGAAVPSTVISLADFGGIPGAGRASIVKAFNRAFIVLRNSAGGTLFIPAGVYDFGHCAGPDYIILSHNLRNIAISAYGATLMVTTSAKVVPNMFYFFNFQNITIAGASFVDQGFSPWVNWQGMYCVGIQADERSSGFRMIDCYAERVVGLFASNNNMASRRYLRDVSIEGEVRNSYYGVGASFIQKNVNVELLCHNVRRAFIASSLNQADIRIKVSSSSTWPGSNGMVSLATSGASTGNVENVRITVDVSGACIHRAYIHFYHLGPEVAGYMFDIDATVNVINANAAGILFLFDHEIDGVQAKTARTWDRISLHGSVAENFRGRIVSNDSVTTSPGTIYIDSNLLRSGRGEILAPGFRVSRP